MATAIEKSLLIIFYRNPAIGKVKTRLAISLGDEKALAVYLVLSAHTRSITERVNSDKVVYYSDFIDREDYWSNEVFAKQLQRGTDLGERMLNAFVDGFERGYHLICIIGTDCYELNGEIIEQAFAQLSKKDAVIGPARDGGYYLLGFKNLTPEIFANKKWSSDSVFGDTINDFRTLGLDFSQLEWLTDVDEEKDLPEPIRHLL